MRVDPPGAGEAAVLEDAAVAEILRGEDDVPEEAARLALARDVGDPVQPVGGVALLDVLDGVPGAVHGAEVLIADALHVLDGVAIEAVLPEPVAQADGRSARLRLLRAARASGEGALGEVHGPRAAGERRLLAGRGELAGERVLVLAEALDVPQVARAHVPGVRLVEVGAGDGAERAVAGAVREQTPGDPRAPRGPHVLEHDRADRAVHDLCAVHARLEEERQVRLGAREAQLAVVVEDVSSLGVLRVLAADRDDLHHDVADARIGLLIDVALRPDPHLGAGVAPEHGPVLDERHAHPQSRGRHRGCGPCGASADHDEVEAAAGLRLFGEPEPLRPERFEWLSPVGRLEVEVGVEEDGVAAAFEAGQIVQRDGRARRQLDDPAVLPVPRVALGPEGRLQGLAVDEQLEPSRCTLRAPGRDPVAGPDPDAMRPWTLDLDLARGVGDGLPHAVREEEGRAHEIHELLVEHPPAQVVERLGLEQERTSRSEILNGRGRGRGEGDEQRRHGDRGYAIRR